MDKTTRQGGLKVVRTTARGPVYELFKVVSDFGSHGLRGHKDAGTFYPAGDMFAFHTQDAAAQRMADLRANKDGGLDTGLLPALASASGAALADSLRVISIFDGPGLGGF